METNKAIMDNIVKNINILLRGRGISKKEFCKRADLARATLSRLEKDNDPILTVGSLVKMANALNVKLEFLMFRSMYVEKSILIQCKT